MEDGVTAETGRPGGMKTRKGGRKMAVPGFDLVVETIIDMIKYVIIESITMIYREGGANPQAEETIVEGICQMQGTHPHQREMCEKFSKKDR